MLSNLLLITLYVLPLSCDFKFLTFSKTIISGVCSCRISTIFQNTFDLSSSNPFFSPAILKGWQGNPPHKILCCGIFETSIVFKSCRVNL